MPVKPASTFGETPPPKQRVRVSVVGALVCLLLAGAAFAAGYRRHASPGPLAPAHADLEGRCASCHEPWRNVSAAGCDRCHDPAATLRLTASAHKETGRAMAGAGVVRPGVDHVALPCADCHREHRGADARPASIERGCETCHGFDWPAHPPFRKPAGQDQSGGLHFSHAVHLPEVQKTRGQGCEGCHTRAETEARFAPVEFDRHCAACHVSDGALSAIKVKTDRPHRDPATLAAAAGLAEFIEPGATARLTEAMDAELLAMAAAVNVAGQSLGSRTGPLSDVAAASGVALDGLPAAIPPASPRNLRRLADLLTVQAVLVRRRQALDAPVEAPPAKLSRQDAESALRLRLAPCLACHEPGGLGLRPVAGARPVFPAASFTHQPHVSQAGVTCETCHADIDRSGSAADVNVPALATCQQCHGSTRPAPTACASCHEYHRSPISSRWLR